MHLLILICLYVVESSRVLGLDSAVLVVSMTAKGHDCRHTLENSFVLQKNHARGKSFQVDRSAMLISHLVGVYLSGDWIEVCLSESK